MYKKLAIAGASTALLLATIVPAFADDGSSVRIRNRANVRNLTVTVANTGLNRIGSGDDVEGGRIRTGDATAYGTVRNNVNDTTVDLCGCSDESSVKVKNKARVRNFTVTVANTGLNNIGARDDVEGGRIRTGGAYADSLVENVVNTTVVGGGSE